MPLTPTVKRIILTYYTELDWGTKLTKAVRVYNVVMRKNIYVLYICYL